MPHLTTDDGVKLYYEETGSGIPIVFVHEFAGDLRSWEAQMRYFGQRYRCIAYNARGYPPSDVPEDGERYSQERARDDIRAVLDALKIDKAHIVGLSMGGFATLHFGFTYPERARSLVVAGCGYGATPDKRAQFAEEAEAARQEFRGTRHGQGRRRLRARADARAVPEQGPARLARIRRSARGAFDRRRGAHHARRAEAAAVAVRPGRQDEGHHCADADHDRRRGLALSRARHSDEADHSDRRAGRHAERRPHHQSGRAGGLQPAHLRVFPYGRCRDLAQARPARDRRRRSSAADARLRSSCSRRRPAGRRRS